MAASVVLPTFLIAPNTSSGYLSLPSSLSVKASLQKLALGLGQHERLASLRIAQHVLDERDGIGCASARAMQCRAPSCTDSLQSSRMTSASVGPTFLQRGAAAQLLRAGASSCPTCARRDPAFQGQPHLRVANCASSRSNSTVNTLARRIMLRSAALASGTSDRCSERTSLARRAQALRPSTPGSNTLPLPTRLFCGSFAGRSGGEARAMCFINRTTRRRVPLVVLALEPNTYIETPSACKSMPAMADCWINGARRTPGCN